MSLKIHELLENFVFNFYFFAKDFKNLEQQNELHKAIIAMHSSAINQSQV
jgi:hypothetical protein